MRFVIGQKYLYKEILELYKMDNSPGLTSQGFLNPSSGKENAPIRAIFARQSKNGPLPYMLCVSGDNNYKNYRSRMMKACLDSSQFLYFNEVNGFWVFNGLSKIKSIVDISDPSVRCLLEKEGYTLQHEFAETGDSLWQFYQREHPVLPKARTIDFAVIIECDVFSLPLDENEKARLGRRINRQVKGRQDQQIFASGVRSIYQGNCIITGAGKDVNSKFIHACHINDDKNDEGHFIDNNPSNGVLLRADLHALFDDMQLSFNIETGEALFKGKKLQALYHEYHQKRCKHWNLVSDITKAKLCNRLKNKKS